MAAGSTHERFNLLALGLASLPALALGWVPGALEGAFALGYLAGTYWLTPDLDLAAQGGSRALARWGALAWLWRPYARAFPHRGLSHSWVLGPLSRLAYLGLLALPLALVPGAVPALRGWVPAEAGWWCACAGGYVAAQWMHLLLDGAWPWAQARRRRRRRAW